MEQHLGPCWPCGITLYIKNSPASSGEPPPTPLQALISPLPPLASDTTSLGQGGAGEAGEAHPGAALAGTLGSVWVSPEGSALSVPAWPLGTHDTDFGKRISMTSGNGSL